MTATELNSTPIPTKSLSRSEASPFCLRLTKEERDRLERDAQGMTLGAYIRLKLFKVPFKKKRQPKPFPEKIEALQSILSELGKAKLANNLNQLAKAANTGTLPFTEETLAEIREANETIGWMRRQLVTALTRGRGNVP